MSQKMRWDKVAKTSQDERAAQAILLVDTAAKDIGPRAFWSRQIDALRIELKGSGPTARAKIEAKIRQAEKKKRKASTDANRA
ncbi:hypothetical protein NKH64_14745 [Mesorhizobium sp. M0999]|uniref:hypothetical protein n=1 Tax=Mesorhizobium sp. M0999 TaxID=2957045 RepID=UPI00333C5002